jgi:CheY-like chemotaxis protein
LISAIEQGPNVQFLTSFDVATKAVDLRQPLPFKREKPSQPGSGAFSSNHEFRILLIDDNRDAIDSMGALLVLLDYDVRTAENAQSALRIARVFQPHLILSDIGLPGMDGYQLAPELRKAAGSRKLILAAATGYGLASDKVKAREAGFDYHLVKPLDADLLIDFVAGQLSAY